MKIFENVNTLSKMTNKNILNFSSDTISKVSEYCKVIKHVEHTTCQEKWIQMGELLDRVSVQNNAVIFLWDTCNSRYIYMSDKTKVLGDYDPGSFTSKNGTDLFFSNVHPDYLNGAILIHEACINYFIDHPNSMKDKIVLNTSYLYKKKGGGYFQFHDQIVVVETDGAGNPLILLCYGYDITHIKKQQSCDLVINSPDEVQIWSYNVDKKKLERVTSLSIQEKKILQLLSEGKPSKEIAQNLFLSSHTIDTHRRNLLKKTNCLNTTGLIMYAKMIGISMMVEIVLLS